MASLPQSYPREVSKNTQVLDASAVQWYMHFPFSVLGPKHCLVEGIFFSFFVFVENRICEVVTAVNMRAIRKWTRDTISGVKCNDLIL